LGRPALTGSAYGRNIILSASGTEANGRLNKITTDPPYLVPCSAGGVLARSHDTKGELLRSVPRGKLSREGSILLDVLRFAAACTVLLSHFGYAQVASGFPNIASAGHLAVAIFFVLSGFVIRYVTLTREATAQEYLIARTSRIYSVVAPALVITVICEFAAWRINPQYYALLSRPFAWSDVPLQIVANLIFQAQDWGYGISPLSNAPFWSLSFECLYYAIYGLFFYRVRGRVPLSFLLLLCAGPSIALMFPVWLLGCVAFDAYRKLSTSRMGIGISSAVFASMSLVLFLARARIREFLVATDEVHRTAWLTRLMLRVPHHQVALADGQIPWLANASASYFVVGFATAVFTSWALLSLDHLKVGIPEAVARWIRLVADSTFALYLLHLPLLIAIVCVLGRPIPSRGFSAAVLGLIILTCVGLAIPLNSLKYSLRTWMESRVSRQHRPATG
jgi:peptidoglycan/LPS O-acetylase OafA/YrhL